MTNLDPFIHRKIVILHAQSRIAQAARAMCEKSVGCVLVSDHESHLIGIVTDRDIGCAWGTDAGNPDLPVTRIMSSPVVTVDEHAKLAKVLRLMEKHGVRRIPVVEEHPHGRQKCIGLVTLDDLIAAQMIDDSHLARIVRSQLMKRTSQYLRKFEPANSFDFFREMEKRAGLKELEIEPARSEEIIKLVLEALVERLHHTGAMHLIAQLPKDLQEELLLLPSGPDRNVNASRILLELQTRFGLDETTAYAALTGTCSAMEQLLDYEQLGHIKAQLPEDFRNLFQAEQSAA